jgi:hypothetical protein
LGAAIGAVFVLLLVVVVPTAATIGIGKKLWPQIQARLKEQGKPIDPYDGIRFGYQVAETGEYWIWSSGPDSSTEADDIYLALSTMSRSSLRRCFTRKAFAVSSSAPHRSS